MSAHLPDTSRSIPHRALQVSYRTRPLPQFDRRFSLPCPQATSAWLPARQVRQSRQLALRLKKASSRSRTRGSPPTAPERPLVLVKLQALHRRLPHCRQVATRLEAHFLVSRFVSFFAYDPVSIWLP